jgi:hypothetical protein
MKLATIIFSICVFAVTLQTSDASTLAEQHNCTNALRTTWLPEAQVKRNFGMENFSSVKFKISRSNCYEFYAVAKSGEIIEAYYHPLTGALVRETRINTKLSSIKKLQLPSNIGGSLIAISQ